MRCLKTVPQIRPSFNHCLSIESRLERLSADTGALAQREILERTNIIDWLTERLHDPRDPSSTRYSLAELLRTRLLLLGQGWRDQSAADRLRQDPSLRVAIWTRRGMGALEEGRDLASQPTLSRVLDTLSREEKPSVPVRGSDGVGLPADRDPGGSATKEWEETNPETEEDDGPGGGRSPGGGPWTPAGKPMERVLSPENVSWVGGELRRDARPVRRELYPGGSYLGNRALKMTLRVVDRFRGRVCGSMIVRMDAGFTEPGLLKGLESRSVPYIAGIRKTEVLNQMAQPYLTQPAGRLAKERPRVWFHELSYQAESWDRARRVVLVVVERPGRLYPDHFWLLTSLNRKRCEAPELLAT